MVDLGSYNLSQAGWNLIDDFTEGLRELTLMQVFSSKSLVRFQELKEDPDWEDTDILPYRNGLLRFLEHQGYLIQNITESDKANEQIASILREAWTTVKPLERDLIGNPVNEVPEVEDLKDL